MNNSIEEILYHYDRLIQMLEEDKQIISRSVQDEILISYRKLIEDELSRVSKKRDELKQLTNRR